MLLVFQLLFTAFTLVAILAVFKRKAEGLLGIKGAFFWLIFWLGTAGVVWWPNSTSTIASALGIGRGADLIVYSALALIFFLLFKLHIKIEAVGRDVTQVVRHIAVDEPQKK